MSKLSPALKALINSPLARPGTVPAPRTIQSVYQNISQGAQAHRVSQPTWLALSTAATMTMNSPESLMVLFQHATGSASNPATAKSISTAELIREAALKCISFNGIPRTINCLNAFRASLPPSVGAALSSRPPARAATVENINAIRSRGRALWDSIYRPFEHKLYDKLAEAHPDLPVVIVNNHYGALLSDPPSPGGGEMAIPGKVGRVRTSIVAVACLRAQTGVGPQVTSHVFGLRKAVEDGTWVEDGETEEGARWLASEEGNVWILKSVDEIVEAIGEGNGSNFAPGMAARL